MAGLRQPPGARRDLQSARDCRGPPPRLTVGRVGVFLNNAHRALVEQKAPALRLESPACRAGSQDDSRRTRFHWKAAQGTHARSDNHECCKLRGVCENRRSRFRRREIWHARPNGRAAIGMPGRGPLPSFLVLLLAGLAITFAPLAFFAWAFDLPGGSG